MSKTPPIEALLRLKRMQAIIKEQKNLDLEWIKLGAECATMYSMEAEEIIDWVKNGRSDV